MLLRVDAGSTIAPATPPNVFRCLDNHLYRERMDLRYSLTGQPTRCQDAQLLNQILPSGLRRECPLVGERQRFCP